MYSPLLALLQCFDRANPTVTLPEWQCEIGFLPFFVIGGIMGLACLLFPSYTRPYLRRSDTGPNFDKDWQIRIMGAILLYAVYFFAVSVFKK